MIHDQSEANQIWVVTRYQYGISPLVSQTLFRGETTGGVAKWRLFSQANTGNNIPIQAREVSANLSYKITKVVRALRLAKRRVRVCTHGCDVNMFWFSRADHTSTNLKKILSLELDKFTLFIHSLVG